MSTALFEGESFPIGPEVKKDGTNFCIFSKNCTGIDLLFFDHEEDMEVARVITLDPIKNRTYHYWHVFVPGIGPGQLYGYRLHGPYDPASGQRFDTGKVMLDPYSKVVAVPSGYKRADHILQGKPSGPFMKSVVADLSAYDWEGDVHPAIPISATVIYEMHVGAFTKNPNSGVDGEKRGTYPGLVEKIPYLKSLGITAVELLPVFQFDSQDAPPGLLNFWGYSPVSFFAPHQGYCSGRNNLAVLDEFRDMVKALHRSGIEVILDVVFNHTSEGGEGGPSYSFKGIDNSIYYILDKDKQKYANYTGTGNTLNANHPVVRRMITDSLRFWVREMHVDGFRFDLASVLARDENGNPIQNPPVLWDIETDPVLAGTKLIAEAWDASGLYQVGSFIGDSWKEWNGRFRDDVRAFLRGDRGFVSRLASRLLGSPDIYGHELREPEQSINFVTCHDGFTLNDLVSYNSKHNEDNREDNRDGSNENLSWNCGEEGETKNPAVEELRNRQIRNFLTINILALGAPMILMGDEVRRTQKGNNNCYCHDKEVSWFDWSLCEKNPDLSRFLKLLIEGRMQRESVFEENEMSLKKLLERTRIQWHGVKLNQPDWSDNSHSIALTAHSLGSRLGMHMMINAYWESLVFEIPGSYDGKSYKWRRWIDTADQPPEDIKQLNNSDYVTSGSYKVQSNSVVVMISELEKA